MLRWSISKAQNILFLKYNKHAHTQKNMNVYLLFFLLLVFIDFMEMIKIKSSIVNAIT